MNTASSAAEPWSRRDAVVVVLCTLLGSLLVLVAWERSSHEVRFEHELPWILLGTAGVALVVAGDGAWLLSGRRALRRARRNLHGLQVLMPDLVIPEAVGSPPGDGGASSVVVLEAIPGLRRYHRPGCLLTAGKAAEPSSRAEHDAAGRIPCGACRP